MKRLLSFPVQISVELSSAWTFISYRAHRGVRGEMDSWCAWHCGEARLAATMFLSVFRKLLISS
jgi:hypothetical protein